MKIEEHKKNTSSIPLVLHWLVYLHLIFVYASNPGVNFQSIVCSLLFSLLSCYLFFVLWNGWRGPCSRFCWNCLNVEMTFTDIFHRRHKRWPQKKNLSSYYNNVKVIEPNEIALWSKTSFVYVTRLCGWWYNKHKMLQLQWSHYHF